MNNERSNAPANDDYQLARDQASVLAGALMSLEKAIKFLMETDLLAIIARAPRADSDLTITLAKPHYDALLARSEAADSERDRLSVLLESAGKVPCPKCGYLPNYPTVMTFLGEPIEYWIKLHKENEELRTEIKKAIDQLNNQEPVRDPQECDDPIEDYYSVVRRGRRANLILHDAIDKA